MLFDNGGHDRLILRGTSCLPEAAIVKWGGGFPKGIRSGDQDNFPVFKQPPGRGCEGVWKFRRVLEARKGFITM